MTMPAQPVTHWHARAATDSFEDELVSDNQFDPLDYLVPELRSASTLLWRDAEIAASCDRFKRAWEYASRSVKYRELADAIDALVEESRRLWSGLAGRAASATEHEHQHQLRTAAAELAARLNRGDDGPHGLSVYPCMRFECSPDDEGERRDLAAARVATTSEE